MTGIQSKTSPAKTPVCYTLSYGMRLDKGSGSELNHPHVPILLPNGSEGSMTVHVMNGTPDQIKARLLQSVDAFFEIYGDL
ncbi:MAG TPA: hypothetical protein VFT92_06145 [Nitrospira sp.]|nr:hypothetical protein [Nitrospira sp.]